MGKRFIGALAMVSAMTLAPGAGPYRLLAQQPASQPAESVNPAPGSYLVWQRESGPGNIL